MALGNVDHRSFRDITLRGSGKKYMTEGDKNEFWQEIFSRFYNRPWTTMEGHRLLFLLCGQSVLLQKIEESANKAPYEPKTSPGSPRKTQNATAPVWSQQSIG